MRNASENYTILNSYEKEYSDFSATILEGLYDSNEDDDLDIEYEKYGNATLVKVKKRPQPPAPVEEVHVSIC